MTFYTSDYLEYYLTLAGWLIPCKSPLWGMGEPDREILAPTTTSLG